MSQFVFESDLHSLLQLDAPIPNAPPARWQRKAKETARPTPSPMRAVNRSHSAGRTPGRTPGQWGGADPGRGLGLILSNLGRCSGFSVPASGKSNSKAQTTPSKPGGDRYIPQRSASQMEVASFLLSKENQPENSQTPTKKVCIRQGAGDNHLRPSRTHTCPCAWGGNHCASPATPMPTRSIRRPGL